ncbi:MULTISPECIES: hypothetical protein [unclassified Azospirillum]|uniref:hypothetical protein n=1 Tax=unclassified Azospirillum TaxID=2630922 RepID=UPI000B7818C1|nr:MULTISPECIES: hypothetical protein [unclassified Azospirillum]
MMDRDKVILPQQPISASPEQVALTRQHLLPAQDAIYDYLLGLRAELDPVLSQRFPMRFGKPYPLGCCLEISNRVVGELNKRIHNPTHAGLAAIRAFVTAGGKVRSIWGVLRESYFQNAMQFGDLYIDVSNDTVTPTKPKVEILPMAQSGLVAIRDIDHFIRTADNYWQMKIYANHALPGLAPFMPMIGIYKTGEPCLQSASDYMIALMLLDRFQMAEHWLRNGPPAPAPVVDAFRDAAAAHLRPLPGQDDRQAAIRACQSLRAMPRADLWRQRDDRVRDYLRLVDELAKRGIVSAPPPGE